MLLKRNSSYRNKLGEHIPWKTFIKQDLLNSIQNQILKNNFEKLVKMEWLFQIFFRVKL